MPKTDKNRWGGLELSCHIMLFKGLAGKCYENCYLRQIKYTFISCARFMNSIYNLSGSQKSGKYKWKTFYYKGGGSTFFFLRTVNILFFQSVLSRSRSLMQRIQRLLLMTPPISQLMWVSTWNDMIQMHLCTYMQAVIQFYLEDIVNSIKKIRIGLDQSVNFL